MVWDSVHEHLLLSQFVSLSASERLRFDAAFAAINQEQRWATWLELAKLNRCEPLAWIMMQKAGQSPPAEVRATLVRVSEHIAQENQARLQSAEHLFSEMRGKGLEVIVLKGQDLATHLYQNLGYKKMNDIDFLVKVRDLPVLSALLKKLGFFSVAKLVGQNDRGHSKSTHHWPPYVSQNLNCVLGVHWGLASPLRPYTISTSELWDRSEPYEYLGTAMRRLSKLDMLHHLLIHLSRYKTGLKELADILNVLREWQPSLVELEVLVLKSNTQDPVFHSLCLVESLWPSPELSELITRLKPRCLKTWARESELKRTRRPLILRSRSTQVSKLERNYALFSLSQAPLERTYFLIKMWGNFLNAPWTEVKKIQYLPDQVAPLKRLWHRLVNPVYVSRLFVHDYGWKLYILLMIHHEYSLLKTYLSALPVWFGIRSRNAVCPNLKQALLAKGIDEAVFMRLKEQLE